MVAVRDKEKINHGSSHKIDLAERRVVSPGLFRYETYNAPGYSTVLSESDRIACCTRISERVNCRLKNGCTAVGNDVFIW